MQVVITKNQILYNGLNDGLHSSAAGAVADESICCRDRRLCGLLPNYFEVLCCTL